MRLIYAKLMLNICYNYVSVCVSVRFYVYVMCVYVKMFDFWITLVIVNILLIILITALVLC